MCATSLNREIRKDCAGSQAPEMDQIRHTHVILTQPCLLFRGRWSGKQKSCKEGYDFLSPGLPIGLSLAVSGRIIIQIHSSFPYLFVLFAFIAVFLVSPDEEKIRETFLLVSLHPFQHCMHALQLAFTPNF